MDIAFWEILRSEGVFMEKILINFEYRSDLALVPNEIVTDLYDLKLTFCSWLKDPYNHNYFINNTLSFDGQAFVDWLNKYILKDAEKATLLEPDVNVDFSMRTMPCVNFS